MAPVTRRKRLSEQAEAETAAANTPDTTPSKKADKLPLRGKGAKSSDEPATEAASPTASAKKSKNSKMVFNDEDDIPAPAVAEAAPAPAEPAEDDEEESDDEAPEAVSTVKAASEIKKTAQASQKAAQEQAAAQKRKRQERDALLKQQAEERKKADVQAAPVVKAAEEQDEEDSVQDVQMRSSGSTRKRAEKIQFPNLLPAEYLSSDDEQEQEGDTQADESRRQKRRKVSGIEKSLARQNKAPHDEAIGSTVFRVATKTDERMAPKVKKQAKSTKELLLKRNRVASKSRSGFLARR